MSAFLGELIGTMILIALGGGVCAGVSLKRSYAANSGWIVIAMGWGLAVAMAAYAVGPISGAHLNPALTVGMALLGAFPWADVPAYIAAQLLGAMAGAVLVYMHYLPHWKVTEDAGAKLGVFATGPAVPHLFGNLMSEIIGTFILVLGILAIGANELTAGIGPFIVGFLIVSIGLSLGGTTGYAINPARDLGPRIMHMLLPIPGKGGSNWGYAWVPVAGPMIGGALGGLFYKTVFLGQADTLVWVVSGIVLVILVIALLTSRRGGKVSEQAK
ncbi:aquaporin family protein [Paenibacillus thiaminolyticus]|uniref:Aquaporin family protein n=1 Tax=Paenibacillus thiaminolyticus TaxID=49283 RepID=A0AAP9DW25_PANTH|nr:MIP/aquaporin family protein [Paenibacillus thiaminolyticus]MCY9534936.1 aquaporin family protein [Paenibacillus thiaminolyticus]MCY9604286.1 aquaporin family protein [Paenibacillus thiaminolyticus]MCY9609616.1 aquaporin family protein [Paenibacillus thiaminolyticus]MCY9612434.1 aquaporin family protein [Paenibacillus thiaminolyticus]MCY9617415.1 aquaporin family protein [Paenibacillus thiaminolyticus]